MGSVHGYSRSAKENLNAPPLNILLFIIILSNAGGQGKTTIARVIKALLEIAGTAPVQILDADAGNAAASMIDPSAQRIGWGVQATVSPQIVEAYSGQHVILDLGANTMASAREIVDMLPELGAAFESAGYSTLAVYPVTPNKPGATGALEKLTQSLPVQEKLLVLNDVDGTGNFEQFELPLPIAKLGQLESGFMAYVNASESGSFSQAVLAPAEDHTILAQHLAHWMREFGQDLPFQTAFRPALNRLETLPKPHRLSFKVKRASRANDTELSEFAQKTRVLDLIQEYGWDSSGLRKAADALDFCEA